jgi:hypothetical protein
MLVLSLQVHIRSIAQASEPVSPATEPAAAAAPVAPVVAPAPPAAPAPAPVAVAHITAPAPVTPPAAAPEAPIQTHSVARTASADDLFDPYAQQPAASVPATQAATPGPEPAPAVMPGVSAAEGGHRAYGAAPARGGLFEDEGDLFGGERAAAVTGPVTGSVEEPAAPKAEGKGSRRRGRKAPAAGGAQQPFDSKYSAVDEL